MQMVKHFLFMITHGTQYIHAAMGHVCANYEKQVLKKKKEITQCLF